MGFLPMEKCGRMEGVEMSLSHLMQLKSMGKNTGTTMLFRARELITRRIPLTEIIAFDPISIGSQPWPYKTSIITFKRTKGNINVWQKRRIVLRFRLLEPCQHWKKTLESLVDKGDGQLHVGDPPDAARPRLLRVFINPISGSGKALTEFKKIKKLFHLAKVCLSYCARGRLTARSTLIPFSRSAKATRQTSWRPTPTWRSTTAPLP